MTGGDIITTRALYGMQIYFKPQFKQFLLCNSLPKIRSDDDGTWRRLCVLLFDCKFIKKSEATSQQRDDIKNGVYGLYYADLKISEKIPDWKQSVMGMLLSHYKKYCDEGMIYPDCVVEETKNYRKRCDVYQDFIDDSLEKTDKLQVNITIADLHSTMREWYRNNYDGKCPNAKELRNYIVQRLSNNYNKKNDHLIGYRFRSQNTMMDNIDDIY